MVVCSNTCESSMNSINILDLKMCSIIYPWSASVYSGYILILFPKCHILRRSLYSCNTIVFAANMSNYLDCKMALPMNFTFSTKKMVQGRLSDEDYSPDFGIKRLI